MNRNRARRCLTGVDKLLTSQVWTGTPMWLIRTRLWHRADFPIPARVEVEHHPKSKLQAAADRYGGGAHLPVARVLAGEWTTKTVPHMPLIGTGVVARSWLRMAVNPSWFHGIDEIVCSTTRTHTLRMNLNAGSLVWQHGDETVAVLMGIWGEPVLAEEDAA